MTQSVNNGLLIGKRIFPFIVSVLSIVWVLLFLRLYLTHSAHQFATDFKRQNYSELAVSDIFSLSTRINALSGAVPWSCVEIRRGSKVFLTRQEGKCGWGLWSEPVQVQGDGQDPVTVDITFVLQRDLVRGAVVFIALQLLVLLSLYMSARQLERERNAGMVNLGQLAAQVAHDIRSPLQALQVVAGGLETSDSQVRELLTGAIDRIRSIAEGLLSEYRIVTPADFKRSAKKTISAQVDVGVEELITALVEEKKHEWGRPGLELQLLLSPDLVVRVPRLPLLRVVSNILNNAKEAIEGDGCIVVKASQSARAVFIEVTDSGKGIPPDILKKLGKQRVTAGKEGGNGLGMSYVYEQVALWGAQISVKSKVGVGTTVRLEFRK